jgi:hypothetical protein
MGAPVAIELIELSTFFRDQAHCRDSLAIAKSPNLAAAFYENLMK